MDIENIFSRRIRLQDGRDAPPSFTQRAYDRILGRPYYLPITADGEISKPLRPSRRRVCSFRNLMLVVICAFALIVTFVFFLEVVLGWPWIRRSLSRGSVGPHSTQFERDIAPKPTRIFTSKRNAVGKYNTFNFEKTNHHIMNPTLLELPKGSQHDFLVIARDTSQPARFMNFRRYVQSRQVAAFANLTEDYPFSPELVTGDWSTYLLDDMMGPEHHCQSQPNMDKYYGPEDMKVFWTRKRVPLVIFTHQTPDETLCQGMFMVDARAAVPELDEILVDDLPPIQFYDPVPVRRAQPDDLDNEPGHEREKNWAPVQSPLHEDADDLFFMVEPDKLFKWTDAESPVERVQDAGSTFGRIEGPYPTKNGTWHSDSDSTTCMHDVMLASKSVHQSTPMLSVTLCNRGDCEPSENNTVLMGMLQHHIGYSEKYPAGWYERHIATYSAVAPYQMLSVSKVLSYLGETPKSFIWTGSMTYWANSEEIRYNRSHGYLDDEIWLSFGIGDKEGGWMDIDASELVEDHYMCQDATKELKEGLSSV